MVCANDMHLLLFCTKATLSAARISFSLPLRLASIITTLLAVSCVTVGSSFAVRAFVALPLTTIYRGYDVFLA